MGAQPSGGAARQACGGEIIAGEPPQSLEVSYWSYRVFHRGTKLTLQQWKDGVFQLGAPPTNAPINAVAIEAVAAELRGCAAEAMVVACDLVEPTQCERAAAAARARYGRIDILVNVAGGSGPIGKSGVETTPEEFDTIVRLNMNGCFH